MLTTLKTKLRALLRRSAMEHELDEELRYHIEQQTEQNIRLGMNPEEARNAAQKAFGGVEQAKERSRDARGMRWFENFWQDIRFGARMLLNKPGFTLIAVITLALGVGANSVIFGFFNGILLRPLPFQQPEQLVLLDEIASKRGAASLGVSFPNYLDWRAQNQVFSDLGGYQDITFTLTGVGDAEELPGAMASDRLFELLGVAPQLGRTFTPEENQPAHLGALGGVAGMALAWLGIDLLLAALPVELPFWMKFNVDGRVLAFTLAVSLLTSLIFGAAPAWQAARIDLIEALKESGRSGVGGSRHRLRRLLVVAQVALALILLAGVGLMMRSFLRLQQVRLGFNPDNVLTLRVTAPGDDYRGGVAPFWRQLAERVNSLPGVEVASAIIPLPLSGVDEWWGNFLTVEGQPALSFGQSPRINLGIITPQYFRTMEIPLLAGRAFNDADARDAPRVAIIDERLAREYWPNESPLGKRIRIGLPDSGNHWRAIVGVVGTVQHERLDAPTRKMVYVPSLQDPTGDQTLVVRSHMPLGSLIAAVKNVVKEMDPNLPITHVAMMREVIAESIWQPRLYAILFAVFAVVALTLAAVGIYGVMSYTVAARTHEIGIRMALGAERRHTLKLVVGQGMVLALGGVGIGVAGALLLTRLMRTLLFGVSATDPLTFAGVSLLLFGVALLACYLPARKAAQVDPLVALRRD